MQESKLWWAELQGASLWEAKLQGADLGRAKLQGANLMRAELQGANLWSAELQGADLRWVELQGANLGRAKLQGANLERAELQGADLTGAELQSSRGKPASWYLAWMRGVSVDFSDSSERDRYLKGLLSDEIKDIELAWVEGLTLEQRLKQSLSGDSDREVFDGAKPDDADLVVHQRTDATWPEAPDVHSDSYWVAWAKWASEFACENEYTARSILQRLSLPEFRDIRWLLSSSGLLLFAHEKGIYDRVRNEVREKLVNARKRRDPECAGLRDLSENEWQAFVDG